MEVAAVHPISVNRWTKRWTSFPERLQVKAYDPSDSIVSIEEALQHVDQVLQLFL